MKQLDLSVTFLPQEEDFVLERLLIQRLQRSKWAVMITRLAGLLLAAGGLIILLVMGLKSVTALILADAMVVAGYVLTVLYDMLLPFFERRRAKKEFAGNAAVRESRRMSVNGSELTVTTTSQTGSYPLDRLMRVIENHGAFVFAADGQTVWTLPQRMLSEEDRFMLIGTLQEKCGERFVWIELSPGKKSKSKQERK